MKTTLAIALAATLAAACGKVTSNEIDGGADAESPPDASPPGPTLTAIDRQGGIVSTPLILTGSDFGAAQGVGVVTVGGQPASVTSWADTSIAISVPDVMPGDRDVVVTTAYGTSGALPFHVILPARVYVQNAADDPTSGFDTVTVLEFNPDTGALSSLGSPVSVGVASSGFGGCSSSLVVHEGTRRVFVTDSDSIAVFDIDPVTGGLTPVSGSPFAVGGTRFFGVVVNADGNRLFAADWSAVVAVVDIAADGTLTPVTGSPFATGSTDADIPMLSHNQQFLYVNDEAISFSALSIAGDGTLTPLSGSPYTASARAWGAAIRPGHDQAYVPNQGGMIDAWALDPTTGQPTPVSGSPFDGTVPAGSPHFPAFTSDGSRVYIGSYSAGYLLGYDVDAAGVLTPMTGSPWDFTASLSSISCMAVSRDSEFLIAENEGNNQVAVFRLGIDGTPTPVSGSPFTQTTPAEDASGLGFTY